MTSILFKKLTKLKVNFKNAFMFKNAFILVKKM